MTEAIVLDPTRLVAAAVIGLVILLVLIIRFKVHAMISILVGAISIGLIAGMPASQIINAVNDGIGNTLKGIALLVTCVIPLFLGMSLSSVWYSDLGAMMGLAGMFGMIGWGVYEVIMGDGEKKPLRQLLDK